VAPYDGLNLGDHVGDEPAAVTANREALARSVPFAPDEPAQWVWLRQVHGRDIVTAERAPAAVPEADGAVTATVGLPLVVMTADCAPIALVALDEHDGTARAVGVVHAGWQGLLAGVVEAGVVALRALHDGPVRAWLGPCVHAGRYEFGAAALAPLVARFGPTVASRTEWGTPALDVATAVGIALREAGVAQVVDVDVCTAASPDHFSHRRDGVTGRQAVVVVRTR
jgi:YfiH family protein